MAKANIFAKAKAKEAPKAAKNEKLTVKVAGKEFADNLAKFNELKAQIEVVKAELEMSDGVVRSTGVDEYIKLIQKNKANPESFILSAENGEKVMFLPVRKYITLDEVKADSLKKTYGDDVVMESVTYSFNPEVLERNIEIISDLIQNSTLSDEDKENLVISATAYKVKENTLDKVYTLATESKNDVSTVLQDIKPQFQLKVTK